MEPKYKEGDFLLIDRDPLANGIHEIKIAVVLEFFVATFPKSEPRYLVQVSGERNKISVQDDEIIGRLNVESNPHYTYDGAPFRPKPASNRMRRKAKPYKAA